MLSSMTCIEDFELDSIWPVCEKFRSFVEDVVCPHSDWYLTLLHTTSGTHTRKQVFSLYSTILFVGVNHTSTWYQLVYKLTWYEDQAEAGHECDPFLRQFFSGLF